MAEKKPGAENSTPARTDLTSSRRGTLLSAGRLQSLRSPRDLTLGGSAKRTYTPRIPSRRIKEEPKAESSEFVPKKEGKQTRGRGRGRGRDRGRGRGRGQNEIVQSKSIFSEGPGAKKNLGTGSIRSSYGGGGGRGGGGGGGSEGGGGGFGVKSAASKSDKGFDVGNLDKILEMLHDDGEMEMDEDKLECGVLPIQLPLTFHDRIKEEEENETALMKCNSEAMETDEKKPFVKPACMAAKRKTSEEQKMTCESLLFGDEAKKKEQLLFFQFPESLPTKEFDDDRKEDSKKSLSFRHISEGYIGKLQVHKSGKTKLILGGVALDVSIGTSCNFLQDLVSVHTTEEKKEILTLDHVKERLVCTPDFEELLKGDKKS